jgi:hypothetical protein
VVVVAEDAEDVADPEEEEVAEDLELQEFPELAELVEQVVEDAEVVVVEAVGEQPELHMFVETQTDHGIMTCSTDPVAEELPLPQLQQN